MSPRRSNRVSKPAVIYNAAASPSKISRSPSEITQNQEGMTLQAVSYIESQLQKRKADDPALLNLHRLLYGRPGDRHSRKAVIRQWKGLSTSPSQAPMLDQWKAKLHKLKLSEIKDLAAVLGIAGSSKSILQDKLIAFLASPKDNQAAKSPRKRSLDSKNVSPQIGETPDHSRRKRAKSDTKKRQDALEIEAEDVEEKEEECEAENSFTSSPKVDEEEEEVQKMDVKSKESSDGDENIDHLSISNVAEPPSSIGDEPVEDVEPSEETVEGFEHEEVAASVQPVEFDYTLDTNSDVQQISQSESVSSTLDVTPLIGMSESDDLQVQLSETGESVYVSSDQNDSESVIDPPSQSEKEAHQYNLNLYNQSPPHNVASIDGFEVLHRDPAFQLQESISEKTPESDHILPHDSHSEIMRPFDVDTDKVCTDSVPSIKYPDIHSNPQLSTSF